MEADRSLLVLQNDLISNILGYAADIDRCAERITIQIREIIGARIVTLFERTADGGFRLLASCPERKGVIFGTDLSRRLVAIAGQLEQAAMIEPGKGEAGLLLAEMGMRESFAVPLRVGDESFGVLILLDLMETRGCGQILAALRDISGLLSLIFKNSFLYRNMEVLVAQKTRALRESEIRSQTILQTAMDGFWCIDSTGRLLEVNDAYCRMSGYERDELLGMSIGGLAVDQPAETVADNLRRVLAGEELRFETVHRRRDGSRLQLEVNTQLRAGSGGREIFAFLRDISERKRTEEALVQAESQLRILINTIPDLVWLKDRNGVYLSCNRSFERLFGASEPEIVGKTDYHFVEKDLADFFREHDQLAMEAGRPCMNEEALTFAEDGYHGLFETIKTPIFDASGNFVGVLGIARDISERKRVETALKESEKRYKSAQRLGNVGNWEYDLLRQIFWGSDQARRIYGFDPASDSFTTEEVEGCIPERERVHQALVDLIERDRPYDLEFAIRPVSGPTARIIRSIAEVERDGHGAPQKVVGVIQDITQQKQAERDKFELERQLRQSQKLEAIGQLAGGVAHDFNNMLGVILGHSEMAMEGLEPQSPLLAALEQIRKAAVHSADITRQLLAFARKQTVVPKVLDLNETVEGILKMLRRLIGENITLTWLPGGNLWPIRIDPTQIDQILANLCVNARDAIAAVGNIAVETANCTLDDEYCRTHAGFIPGDYVRMAVSDNGCGMDEATMARIFDPFFTTKPVGEGTGLGLATVYGAVRQNDGFINACSEPGKGTTISLYFPRYDEMVKRVEESVAIRPTGGHETILLVEDEPTILKMTTMMLERLGYTVLTAATPGEALRLVEDGGQKIDLLLTDVIMPEMNGSVLVERVLARQPGMKHLFMSGYTANIIASQGVLDEGVAFIQKPFARKDLADKIREILG